MKRENFKDGDPIICNINGTQISDAKVRVENGRRYICQNLFKGSTPYDGNLLGYKSAWSWDEQVTKVIQPNIFKFKDILTNDKGEKRMVLDICEDSYFLSANNNFKKMEIEINQKEINDYKLITK